MNYTPLYYLFNGVAFNKTNAPGSLFPAAPATGVTGNVLVRLVNAGLRMLKSGGDFADGVIAYEGQWLGAGEFVSFDRSAVKKLNTLQHTARLLE